MNLYLRLLAMMVRARLRPRRRLSLWDGATTPFRVWPTDLDVLGHMNNGKYLTIMDLARVDLMMRSGFWRRLRERGWYPVVAGQTITYRRSLQPFQRFDVRTDVLGAEGQWLYLQQVFCSRGQEVAHAVVRARFLRREGGSVSVEELFDEAGKPERDLTVPAWIPQWTADTRSASPQPPAE